MKKGAVTVVELEPDFQPPSPAVRACCCSQPVAFMVGIIKVDAFFRDDLFGASLSLNSFTTS